MASDCFSMLNRAAVRVTTVNADLFVTVILHKSGLLLVLLLILMAAIILKIQKSRY